MKDLIRFVSEVTKYHGILFLSLFFFAGHLSLNFDTSLSELKHAG